MQVVKSRSSRFKLLFRTPWSKIRCLSRYFRDQFVRCFRDQCGGRCMQRPCLCRYFPHDQCV